MKNILLVHGSDFSKIEYQALLDVKKLGYKLYSLRENSFIPSQDIFEKNYIFDLQKTKEILNFFSKEKIKFNAVVTGFSDWLTTLTALLATKYKCIGNEPHTAFNCRSKYHMRKELEKSGIPSPKFKLCRNFEEIKLAISEIGLPCVAKPIGGCASCGVFIIKDEKDLQFLEENYKKSIKYLDEQSKKGDVFFQFSAEEYSFFGIDENFNMVTDYLVEEYLDGPEISIDAIVQDGNVSIIGVEDQIRMQPPYCMQIAARLPYVCSKEIENKIHQLVCDTIKALNIKNSATHTEIIFTKDGPKIVEIGCRIGGNDLHDTIFHATGYNLLYEVIMVVLGIKREYKKRILNHTMMEFFIPTKKGKVKNIIVPEHIKNHPNVIGIEIYVVVGENVDIPPNRFDSMGYISVKGKTPTEAQNNLNRYFKEILIDIE